MSGGPRQKYACSIDSEKRARRRLINVRCKLSGTVPHLLSFQNRSSIDDSRVVVIIITPPKSKLSLASTSASSSSSDELWNDAFVERRQTSQRRTRRTALRPSATSPPPSPSPSPPPTSSEGHLESPTSSRSIHGGNEWSKNPIDRIESKHCNKISHIVLHFH